MVLIVNQVEELKKSLEFNELVRGLQQLSDESGAVEAVPLEQLKGDIARMGHPVARAIALDVDNRRLFFVDKHDNFLFAEYGSSDEGFRLSRVGFQAEIAKEYDVQDPKREPFGRVETEHEEEEQGTEPGVVPSGTPGNQPEDEDERGFGERVAKALTAIKALG